MPRSRTVLIWILTSICASIACEAYLRASLPSPRINVRWAEAIGERERVALEQQFRLTEGEFRERRTWSYRLNDLRRANVAALLSDPQVEDTYGIDPATLQVEGAASRFDTLPTSLLVGFGISTLALVGLANRGRIVAALRRAVRAARRTLPVLPSKESPVASAVCLAVPVLIATIVKWPSWRAVAWDEEELWGSVLTTALHARYWAEGTWLPLWNPFQGFGIPHPAVAHLIYAPLFPLMLVFPDGIALSLHYSIMLAVGVGSTFLLSRRLGASPFLAGAGGLAWLSSSVVTQLLFVDFWTQAFTFINAAPALVVALLKYFDTAARKGVRIQDVLLIGLAGGIVLSCTTPAGSVPFAVPLAVMAAVFLHANRRAAVAWLLPAFVIAVAIYAPSLVELWQEMGGRFSAVRPRTMQTPSVAISWAAFAWPVSGSTRAAGIGAPFAAVALVSVVLTLLPHRVRIVAPARRAIAAAAAACLVMYLLPGDAFPIASGNGEWGQLLIIFAIPLAVAQIATWYRSGTRRVQFVMWAIIAVQLALGSYWVVRWWGVQAVKDPTQGVGFALGGPSELERTLLARVRPDRDRVLLSPLAEDSILRRVDFGHASSFVRLGIPLVNGWFKFVSYNGLYPDFDPTWGTMLTHGERLSPAVLDLAGITVLVTLDSETPPDPSMRYVGRYQGLQSAPFKVWENLDAWPRVSFIDAAVETQGNPEAGVVLWRRRHLPSRRPDPVTYEMTSGGRYSIRFQPAGSDRLLLISSVLRADSLTVRGAHVIQSAPLSDVFTVLKIPAGGQGVDATWENPHQRWLWTVSYLTFALAALACVIMKARDRAPVPPASNAS